MGSSWLEVEPKSESPAAVYFADHQVLCCARAVRSYTAPSLPPIPMLRQSRSRKREKRRKKILHLLPLPQAKAAHQPACSQPFGDEYIRAEPEILKIWGVLK